MYVSINPETCIGCGICTDICTETFEMGADQKARVTKEPNKDHEECAKTAAEDCPTDAIMLN